LFLVLQIDVDFRSDFAALSKGIAENDSSDT